MNCPVFIFECPENPGQMTRTDTRAHMETGQCPSGFPSCLSGLCPVLQVAESLLSTGVLTPWQRAFVVGCRRHVDAGRALTEKQAGVLRRLIDIASDAEVSA